MQRGSTAGPCAGRRATAANSRGCSASSVSFRPALSPARRRGQPCRTGADGHRTRPGRSRLPHRAGPVRRPSCSSVRQDQTGLRGIAPLPTATGCRTDSKAPRLHDASCPFRPAGDPKLPVRTRQALPGAWKCWRRHPKGPTTVLARSLQGQARPSWQQSCGHPQKPVGIWDFVIHLSCRDVEAGRWNIDRFSDLRSTLSG